MANCLKNEFRTKCIKRLRTSVKLSKYRNDKFINDKLKTMIKTRKIKTIFLYLPLKIEVDLRHLINWLRQNNYKVYVPYVTSKTTFKEVLYRLPLNKNKFKIYEPNNSNKYIKTKFDMAIVPIIGFDDTFRRIGFGFGYYDRYFSNLKQKPFTVFTQISTCKSSDIITDDYDLQANCIITNKGILWNKNYKT